MTEKTIINGFEKDKICNLSNCNIYKQLKRKEQECEELNKTVTNLENIRDEFSTKLDQLKAENGELKRKLNPKLKNAHCTYFEGQTGLCKAKEFSRCNPVGCKLYTIDELSTIVDLQEQLDKLKEENDKLKTEFDKFEEQIKLQGNFIDSFLFATKNSEWQNKSILEDEADAIIEKVESDYVQLENYRQALQEIKDYCNKYPQNSIGFKKQILQKCEVIDEM